MLLLLHCCGGYRVTVSVTGGILIANHNFSSCLAVNGLGDGGSVGPVVPVPAGPSTTVKACNLTDPSQVGYCLRVGPLLASSPETSTPTGHLACSMSIIGSLPAACGHSAGLQSSLMEGAAACILEVTAENLKLARSALQSAGTGLRPACPCAF